MPGIELIKKDIDYIRKSVTTNENNIREGFKEINDKFDHLSDMYVTRSEFLPVKLVVYGIVSSVGLSVVGAILALIVK